MKYAIDKSFDRDAKKAPRQILVQLADILIVIQKVPTVSKIPKVKKIKGIQELLSH